MISCVIGRVRGTHAASMSWRRDHNTVLLDSAVTIEVADKALGRGRWATKVVRHLCLCADECKTSTKMC